MIVRPRHFVAFVAVAAGSAAVTVAGISHLAQAATLPPVRSSSGFLGEAPMVSAQGEGKPDDTPNSAAHTRGERFAAADLRSIRPCQTRASVPNGGWTLMRQNNPCSGSVTLWRDRGFASWSQDKGQQARGTDPRTARREPSRDLSLVTSLQGAASAAAHLCGVDGDIYAELIGRESTWRQFDADGRTLRSSQGALGLSQILPTTAAEISPTLRPDVAADNALAGACHLRRLLDRFGSYRVALAAYVIGANSPHLHTSPKAKAYAEGILAAAEARR